MKLLIIQQKMIGDVLTTSILFEAIKKEYPKSELHYVINSHTYPVVENHPYIDQFHFVTPEIENSKSKLFSFLKLIKQQHFDVVIDVYSKTSSNLMSLFSRAKTKISKHKWYTAFIYNHTFKDATIKKTVAGLAIENRLQLLQPLNIQASEGYKPSIHLKSSEIEHSKVFLENAGIDLSKSLYMIGVLGSGANKTYPFQYMAEVIDTIVSETKGQILFNYIPKQEDDAKKIYELCNETTKSHIFFEVFGKSLRDFLAITHHCTALIGNEGGATNMAKALNKPTFTIFSPWIDKDAWNMFDNGTTNVSVHLSDFSPELYQAITQHKDLKRDANNLYLKLEPKLFVNRLKTFLAQF